MIPNTEESPLYIDERGVWVEEYPLESPPRHVLNGFVFGMLGIYDAYLVTQEDFYRRLFYLRACTLKRNIHLYDLYFWSRYDVAKINIANNNYHLLNIMLVYIVASLMKDRESLQLVKRWIKGYYVFTPFL